MDLHLLPPTTANAAKGIYRLYVPLTLDFASFLRSNSTFAISAVAAPAAKAAIMLLVPVEELIARWLAFICTNNMVVREVQSSVSVLGALSTYCSALFVLCCGECALRRHPAFLYFVFRSRLTYYVCTNSKN